MKRTVVGRASSPTSSSLYAASSFRTTSTEKEKKPTRSTLAWGLALATVVAIHVLAGYQVYRYLTASCTPSEASLTTPGEGTDGDASSAAAAPGAELQSASGPIANAPTSGNNETDPVIFYYRIIGNNMPPLQCPSQLLWNTQYALKYESDLPGCKKRWVINKIVNATERAELIDSLISAGYTMDDILIRWFNATQVALQPKERWLDVVTQQNEARNLAIQDGIKSGARWIMPFDGNHFMTRESWATIQRSARKSEERNYKYFKVPVHRLYKEQKPGWLNTSSKFIDIKKHAPVMIESQLVFRNDAPARFQHGMVYGMQNKLETLARVCGDREDPKFVQNCWCDDLGKEGQLHPSSPRVAKECGYSLRLWFYPCNGTEAMKVFKNGMYRKKLRADSRRQMYSWVKREAQTALKQLDARQELRMQQLKHLTK